MTPAHLDEFNIQLTNSDAASCCLGLSQELLETLQTNDSNAASCDHHLRPEPLETLQPKDSNVEHSRNNNVHSFQKPTTLVRNNMVINVSIFDWEQTSNYQSCWDIQDKNKARCSERLAFCPEDHAIKFYQCCWNFNQSRKWENMPNSQDDIKVCCQELTDFRTDLVNVVFEGCKVHMIKVLHENLDGHLFTNSETRARLQTMDHLLDNTKHVNMELNDKHLEVLVKAFFWHGSTATEEITGFLAS